MQTTEPLPYCCAVSVFWLLGILVALKIGVESAPDEELVGKIVDGNDRAFRVLFNRYHADLYRFLVRTGAPETVAEDILQDVFTGLWTARSGLDPSRSIRAYLYRACRNRAANHFKARSRLTQELSEEPPSTAPSQEEQLEHSALMDLLAQAVSELPERRRAVFELCFISGLSYKEAAEALEISPKTVENQMGYAFKAIRKRLAPFVDPPLAPPAG
jgi:RNA polymerase sigma-19 factor, ECF subfamily